MEIEREQRLKWKIADQIYESILAHLEKNPDDKSFDITFHTDDAEADVSVLKEMLYGRHKVVGPLH